MRTTLTLDDDVAAKLQAETRQRGTSFKETVNTVLRRGLNVKHPTAAAQSFVVRARDLGRLRTGLSLDSIADVLDTIEGPQHR